MERVLVVRSASYERDSMLVEEFPGDSTFKVVLGELRILAADGAEIAAFAATRWAHVRYQALTSKAKAA